LYLDGIRPIFDLFSRKIQDFLKESLEFAKSEKRFGNLNRDLLLANFEPSSIF
jgi:hypothetical protein